MFAYLACRPEAELDLAQAALAIAAPEYPGLDIGGYLRALDRLAEEARPVIAGVREAASQATSLLSHLIHERSFRGNVNFYEDPRNSFLNEVIDRRLGIPISLAVLMMEIARRLGVPLAGVSFPGHFLLRAGQPTEAPLYLDPFTGAPLTQRDLRELIHRHTSERRDPRPQELEVASKQAILVRMLNNLRNIYAQHGDLHRVRLASDRIRALERGPSFPLQRTSGVMH